MVKGIKNIIQSRKVEIFSPKIGRMLLLKDSGLDETLRLKQACSMYGTAASWQL